MPFKDVVGQQSICQKLEKMITDNRLGHAILLVGESGHGLLTIAVNFAQHIIHSNSLSTTNISNSTSLFEETTSETKSEEHYEKNILALAHPDMHFVYPIISDKAKGKSLSIDYFKEFQHFYQTTPYGSEFTWLQTLNAENKQGNITAEECHQMVRKLSLKPFMAKVQVMVIWLPEYLGKEGNRLLKILEEPPGQTIFILAAQDQQKLLGTIISRCQIIKIPPIEQEDLSIALQKIGVPKENASTLALVSNGNLATAYTLMEAGENPLPELLKSWLNATLVKGDRMHQRFELQTNFSDEIAKHGRTIQKYLLRYFIQLIEYAVRLNVHAEFGQKLSPNELDFAEKIQKIAGLGQLNALAIELNKSIYYIERNANAKILFLSLTLKIRSIILDKHIIEAA